MAMVAATRAEIPLFRVYVAPDAAAQTTKTLNSGYITQGPRVEEFEDKMSAYLQNPYVLTLNSATSGGAFDHHAPFDANEHPTATEQQPNTDILPHPPSDRPFARPFARPPRGSWSPSADTAYRGCNP
jgi:hypothetical protein